MNENVCCNNNVLFGNFTIYSVCISYISCVDNKHVKVTCTLDKSPYYHNFQLYSLVSQILEFFCRTIPFDCVLIYMGLMAQWKRAGLRIQRLRVQVSFGSNGGLIPFYYFFSMWKAFYS